VVALSFNPPNQRGALYARSSAVRGRFASDRAQRSAVQGLERGSGRQGAPACSVLLQSIWIEGD
jgi:hypothetical protein